MHKFGVEKCPNQEKPQFVLCAERSDFDCLVVSEKDEMGRTCGAYGEGKRGAQGVGGET
jgi:hypothetical protein